MASGWYTDAAGHWRWRQECEICGVVFEPPHRELVCSDECRRTKERDRGRERRGSRLEEAFVCAGCGAEFTAKRSDAKYCGGRCRVAAHRAGNRSLFTFTPISRDEAPPCAR